MALQDEITQLVTNLGSVSTPTGQPAIKKVYAVPPISGSGVAPPSTEDTPCIVVFLRKPPVISFMTFGVERRDTNYTIQFIYSPVGSGIFSDNYNGVLAYCEPILDALWAHTQLNSVTGVNWSVPKQETMPAQLADQWGGQAYLGADFSLAVATTRTVTYGA